VGGTQASVSPATSADLADVARIYAHYVTDSVATFEENAPGVDFWQVRLDDLAVRRLPFLVAKVGGEVAGYAYVSPWRPKPAYRHTVEDSIYLAPDRTGQGLGRALLGTLLTSCAQTDTRQVIAVIADTGSDASVALHLAFGFTHAGRLKSVGHKHDRWIDTVLMQRTLGA
jgi:phosphinothricin acetyltransferase